MNLLGFLSQPWAITPEKFTVMEEIYERHLAGVSLDAEAIKAAIGGSPSSSSSDSGYTVQDGVAVIPVDGVLAKRMNIFTAISGGTSTQMLVDTINQAVADPGVHSLMLAVDSPGGEVDGTQQVADAVAASTKPTSALIDGQGCSAAMWIASQCDSIWAASDTTEVGSIGVLMKHTDRTKANEAGGKTITHITTGKFKTAGSSDKSLSLDDRAYLQSNVDYLYTLFVGAVADGRGMTPESVVSVSGDAQIFYAQQAVDNGLIDGIASESEVIGKLVSANQTRLSNPAASASAPRTAGANSMSVFKAFASEAEYNAEIAAAVERGKASATVTTATVDAARNEALAAGAKSERERITAIEALPLAKVHAAVVTKCKADGSTPEQATAAILAAEGSAQAQAGHDRTSEVQPPVNASAGNDAKESKELAAAAGTTEPKSPTVPQIRAHIATAKAQGRTINSAEAMAELEAAAT